MSTWRGLWERYLGLPEAGAGEGTLWTCSFSTPWPDGWPAWLACLIAAALIASLIWSYRREAATLAVWQRVVLCGLRFAAIVVALWLWSQPTLLVARTGLPPVAIALDTSGSMGLRDSVRGQRSEVGRKKTPLLRPPTSDLRPLLQAMVRGGGISSRKRSPQTTVGCCVGCWKPIRCGCINSPNRPRRSGRRRFPNRIN